MTGCNRVPTVTTVPLVQIRQGVAAEFAGLHLTVELDADGWNVCVRDSGDGRTLYGAQRCNLSAGKIAASEFAAARGATAWGSPEMIARALEWKVYW